MKRMFLNRRFSKKMSISDLEMEEQSTSFKNP